MSKVFNIFVFLLFIVLIFSCRNTSDTPIYDRDVNDSIVIHLQNNGIENKKDSIGFIEDISRQKLQEVYDLLSWYSRKDLKNLSDEDFMKQLQSYFYESDTLQINKLKSELDSTHAFYTKVAHINVLKKDSLENDSIQHVNFEIQYFGKDKKFLKKTEKSAHFILSKPKGNQNKQFTFYFIELGKKDTIRSGVTQ